MPGLQVLCLHATIIVSVGFIQMLNTHRSEALMARRRSRHDRWPPARSQHTARLHFVASAQLGSSQSDDGRHGRSAVRSRCHQNIAGVSPRPGVICRLRAT